MNVMNIKNAISQKIKVWIGSYGLIFVNDLDEVNKNMLNKIKELESENKTLESKLYWKNRDFSNLKDECEDWEESYEKLLENYKEWLERYEILAEQYTELQNKLEKRKKTINRDTFNELQEAKTKLEEF